MDPYELQSVDAQEAEETAEQYVNSHTPYFPYLGTEYPAHPRSRVPLAPSPTLSRSTSHHGTPQQPHDGVPVSNPLQYSGTDQQGYPMRSHSSTATEQQNTWADLLYGSNVHSNSCDNDAYPFLDRYADLYIDRPTGYVYTGLPFQGSLLYSQDPQQELRNERYELRSPRPPVTFETGHPHNSDAITYGTTSYVSNTPTHAFRHQGESRGLKKDSYRGRQAPPNQAIDDQTLSRGIYSPAGNYSSTYIDDWISPFSGSSGATPRTEGLAGPSPRLSTPSEGSDDPDQGNHITSQSSPGSLSFSARFRVPHDVFLNPADPVRHELYHRIRQESWFLNQTQERPITDDEASRIPGSLPGESVLLAFYDRVPDAKSNRTVMRCTICMQTNQDTHSYPRPDRARVHMQHHFDLRPILCNGLCNVLHCPQRFFTNGDLNAHLAGKTESLVKCQYCAKPLHFKNLQHHIDQFCHRAPPAMRRAPQGQGKTMSAPLRLLAPPLTFPSQQSHTPLVNNEKKTTDISLGGRTIQLVMYGRISSEDVHRAWAHRQTKFSSIIDRLSAVYHLGAMTKVVFLEADWGPRPCWNEADPDSSIGEACQVLYVVVKRQFTRYILGVVRNSLTDFPVCISISKNAFLNTISECITASHPELIGRIKAITDYANGEDVSDRRVDSARVDTISFSTLRTAIIITLENPPDKFAASPPSHIHNLWELITLQNELSYKPVPALLQVPFLYCEHLMQRAYTLAIFALQMIHITGATRHLIISLANEMKAVFADQPSEVVAVLAAEGALTDFLQVAPLLSHELKTILDRISRVIDQLEEDIFSRQEAQKEIDAIFTSLCGEFPGAVTVRHSDKLFKKLGSIDRQENQALERHDATSPEMIQRNVSNERDNASGQRYDQDADHEMLVGTSPARRRGIGEDMMMDLDELEREAEWSMN